MLLQSLHLNVSAEIRLTFCYFSDFNFPISSAKFANVLLNFDEILAIRKIQQKMNYVSTKQIAIASSAVTVPIVHREPVKNWRPILEYLEIRKFQIKFPELGIWLAPNQKCGPRCLYTDTWRILGSGMFDRCIAMFAEVSRALLITEGEAVDGGWYRMIFFRREVLQISILVLKDKILKVSLENRKQDLQNVLPTFVNIKTSFDIDFVQTRNYMFA